MCTAALLTLSVVPGALAAPAISWTFSPDFHASGLTGAVDVRGTLLNTGAETIVGINFLQASTGTLGPYITNWAWNASVWDNYNNASGGGLLDIAPGETFDFYVATLSYDNAPAGQYTAVSSVAIGVLSAGCVLRLRGFGQRNARSYSRAFGGRIVSSCLAGMCPGAPPTANGRALTQASAETQTRPWAQLAPRRAMHTSNVRSDTQHRGQAASGHALERVAG